LNGGSDEGKTVWKRLQTRSLAYRDRSVLIGMKVATLFGFEELGPYGWGRLVPLHPSENINAAGGLLQPALRRNVWALAREVKSVPAWRNALVPLDALFRWVSWQMPILAGWPSRKIGDRVADGYARGDRRRQRWNADTATYDDRAAA
jgi:hypothetical protein